MNLSGDYRSVSTPSGGEPAHREASARFLGLSGESSRVVCLCRHGGPITQGRLGQLHVSVPRLPEEVLSKPMLAACEWGPGAITPCLRGGSLLSARITTQLFRRP
jgi:hypothetical protein